MSAIPRPLGQRRTVASAAAWTASAALTLAAALMSAPALRHLIEQSMVWHMVVQMPLLILAGWSTAQNLTAYPFRPRYRRPSAWNQFGLTGGLAAFVVLTYWMLPSSIDRALVVPSTDVVKLISLWACGVLLQKSARRAPLVLQLFFVGTALPMLVWAGLYFASTDLRLCNAYSLDSQIAAGRSLAALAAALGAWWTASAVLALRHDASGGVQA